jgi:hypothetical protein
MTHVGKQLHNREYYARKLLTCELRLSAYYRHQLSNPTAALYPEEREYMKRVVDAADKLSHYLKNCSDSALRIRYVEMVLLRGDNDVQAVCGKLHISKSTYYNWRKSCLRVFGANMGVYL